MQRIGAEERGTLASRDIVRDVSTALDMTTDSAMRILVLADTHNRSPADLSTLAKEADEIWHLGDVCAPTLLDELRLLGPPVMVVDLVRQRLRFRLQHIPPLPHRPPNDCDVLLHGHTHVPRDETISGVRFLNPGCVTRPNRGAPPSVAYLGLTKDGKVEWNLVRLSQTRRFIPFAT